MNYNPYLGAAAEGAIAAENIKDEWQAELARREKWFRECHAFFNSIVRANLSLAAEASGHWGYEVKVSEISKTENHTGKTYIRCGLQIDVDAYPARLEFVLSIESKIFTAEAHKKTGRKIFKKCPVESGERNQFVENTIKEYLKWVVVP